MASPQRYATTAPAARNGPNGIVSLLPFLLITISPAAITPPETTAKKQAKEGQMQFHPQTETLFFAAMDPNITIQLLQDGGGRTTGLAIQLPDGRGIHAERVDPT